VFANQKQKSFYSKILFDKFVSSVYDWMGQKIILEKVIVELANDREAALEQIFHHYYPRLYKFSKSFLKLEDGIDDLLQEVFLKIWQNRKNITSTATFNSYIFTITRNLLLNELRSRLNNQKIKDKLQELSVAEEYSLFSQIEYNDLQEKIDQAITELPARQQQIFLLSRKNGLSHKEIAEKLEVSTKTVEYNIAQSTNFLKQKFKGLGLVSLLYFHLFL
jgi:RNA polymerase sigma-70 factor (ECF subfamily)